MGEIWLLFDGEVQLFTVIFPRLEAEVAVLIVERVPRDVDWTLRDGMFEQRPPDAGPVAVDAHVVGLWRSVSHRLLFRAARNSKRRSSATNRRNYCCNRCVQRRTQRVKNKA